MKHKNLKPTSPRPAEPASPDEMRAFARFLAPLFEQEWQSELTSPAPRWMYLAILHRRLRELEEQSL